MVNIIHVLFPMLAYVVGAVPAVYFLGRWQGIDLKKVGSRNVGVTNLLEHGGFAIGVAGIASDFMKGLAPPAIALWIGLGTTTAALSGVASVAGQMWPVFLGFKGGRGNLTACAVMLVIAPAVLTICAAPILLGVALSGVQRRLQRGWPDILGGALGVFFGVLVGVIGVWMIPYPPEVRWSVSVLGLLLLLRRVTAELSLDLHYTGRERWVIHCTRLLLDRARA